MCRCDLAVKESQDAEDTKTDSEYEAATECNAGV